VERRAASFADLRAAGRRLTGYAATFGREARIAPDVIERIAPGAFAASLASGNDILALVDHDPGRVLARTRSGTLRLAEDAHGLRFDLDLPDTQAGRDVLALAERGDLGGMSFGFRVRDERMDGQRRELRAVDLFEVSVVQAWPSVRSRRSFTVSPAGLLGTRPSRRPDFICAIHAFLRAFPGHSCPAPEASVRAMPRTGVGSGTAARPGPPRRWRWPCSARCPEWGPGGGWSRCSGARQ